MFEQLVQAILGASMEGFHAANWRVTRPEAEAIANRLCERLASLIEQGHGDAELDMIPLAQLLGKGIIDVRMTRAWREGPSQ